MRKRALFLAAYFLAPFLLIMAIFSSNTGYYGASGFIPMVLGATAYTLLNAQLILSARPKWIEASFGLDRFYRFHGLMAVIAVVLALAHKLLEGRTFPNSFQTKPGEMALVLFIGVSTLALVFMADTLVRLFLPLRFVRAFFVRLKIGKYNVQKILHNVSVLAVALAFLHVMLTYSAHNPLVKALYILYVGAAMGFYLYHKVFRKWFAGKCFMVEALVPESGSMTTLVLRPRKGSVFSYLPGQFGFLRVFQRGISSEEHPFSISSQPLDKSRLRITIKNLGDWTGGVRNIQPGSKVLLDAPYGRFSPPLYDCKDGIVLIAGGVGITPMLSILRYYAQADRAQKIILLWGVSRQEELICQGELRAMQSEMKQFTFLPVVNAPDFSGEKGYITQEKIERVLHDQGADRQKQHYFFCGPAPMWAGIQKSLRAMGVPKRMIHAEHFSL
ncbi:MAG: ferredoxin reductase family protein [Ethanoligenens sp.]